MDQEAVLLQKIDRLRASAAEENGEKRIARLLEEVRLYMPIHRWDRPRSGQP